MPLLIPFSDSRIFLHPSPCSSPNHVYLSHLQNTLLLFFNVQLWHHLLSKPHLSLSPWSLQHWGLDKVTLYRYYLISCYLVNCLMLSGCLQVWSSILFPFLTKSYAWCLLSLWEIFALLNWMEFNFFLVSLTISEALLIWAKKKKVEKNWINIMEWTM